ncbi:MAG: hypothetical protein AAFX93_07090 [Verrucomicrobiota bacterium]
MNINKIRSIFLWLFIGFLSLTALIGIASVLIGEWSETQLKVLATTFSISAASVCAMACAAFIEKRKRGDIGGIGVALNFIAASALIVGVWAEMDGEMFWKSTLSAIVLALSFTHACLMHLPTLATAYRWTQAVVVVLISILGVMILYVFWAEVDAENYFRLLAVVSIITVLFTLVIPILAKISSSTVKVEAEVHLSEDHLYLKLVEPGLYRDPDGKEYRVSRVS